MSTERVDDFARRLGIDLPQPKTIRPTLFENNEQGYLDWLRANHDGYVINTSRPGRVPSSG